MELEILWQDEHLVVVDKPPGMLVVNAPGRRDPTLVDLLGRQLGGTVFAVHRLDEDTTGVLIVARTPEARSAFDDALRRRQIEREYRAAVSRVPSPPSGRIESRLLKGEGGIVRTASGRGGKTAITLYRTLERRDYGALLACTLETGRRNQIRVHLSELGCPILGDRKYGYRPRRGAIAPSRPLLHAVRIGFVHPFTEERVTVERAAVETELNPLRA